MNLNKSSSSEFDNTFLNQNIDDLRPILSLLWKMPKYVAKISTYKLNTYYFESNFYFTTLNSVLFRGFFVLNYIN